VSTRLVVEQRDLGAVRVLHASKLRRCALRQNANDVARGVRILEQDAKVVAEGLHVAGREQSAPHRQQMRDEADREAERLRDLGRVLMAPDAIGRHVLEHEARVRARLQLAARARDARLAVHDNRGLVDRAGDRRECEQCGGRVAARVRDQVAGGQEELGDRIAPGAGRRAVVRARLCRVGEAMRAGEVDDDRVGRRLDGGRALVPDTEEDDVRAGGERLVVRDESRQRAVQPQVERRSRVARKRVGAEGDDLELRVPQDAVERLLAGVPGRADDRSRRHCCILCIFLLDMQVRGRDSRPGARPGSGLPALPGRRTSTPGSWAGAA